MAARQQERPPTFCERHHVPWSPDKPRGPPGGSEITFERWESSDLRGRKREEGRGGGRGEPAATQEKLGCPGTVSTSLHCRARSFPGEGSLLHGRVSAPDTGFQTSQEQCPPWRAASKLCLSTQVLYQWSANHGLLPDLRHLNARGSAGGGDPRSGFQSTLCTQHSEPPPCSSWHRQSWALSAALSASSEDPWWKAVLPLGAVVG